MRRLTQQCWHGDATCIKACAETACMHMHVQTLVSLGLSMCQSSLPI